MTTRHPIILLSALTLACAAALGGPAEDILKATGVQGGLIVHLGCGDGKVTAALRADERYLVHGLDPDADEVAAAREHIRSLGLYGKVSVETFAGKRLPHADNLVNLVVVEARGDVPMSDVLRVLAPQGVAYVRAGNSWQKAVKPRPDEMDEWTHYLHDASNNAVAKDTLVGPPRRVQWVSGPRWARSHDHLSSTSAVVSTAGRVFTIIDEGSIASVALPPKWFLVARDAFNGVLLWKRPVGPWEGHLRNFRSGPPDLARRLVAVGDRVYVTLGYGKPVTALDAATGKTVAVYDATANALEFILHEGALLVVVGDRVPDNTDGAAIPAKPKDIWHWWPIYEEKPPKKHLVAVAAETGKVLWKKDDADTAAMLPTALCAAGQRAFLQSPEAIIALEAATGREAWRAPRPLVRQRPSWSAPTLVVADGIVLSADRGAVKGQTASDEGQWMVNSLGGQAPVGQLVALEAATGKPLWTGSARECYNAPTDVLVAGGLVWTGSLVSARDPGITAALDLKTGQVARKRANDQKQFRIAMSHHRCYRNKATEKYLVLGRDGIEFIDLATGEGQAHMWVRGACQYGVMPCNGLVYAPPHSCACHIETKLNSFNALAPAKPSDGNPAGPQLEKGPAYGGIPQSAIPTPQSKDWPTYRANAARSGSTALALPAALQPAWQRKLGGKLSSVVVAEGKLLVAQIDVHTVHALDSGTGKTIWTHTAGGRVDSPPTVHRGATIFGSADGRITCLRLADGALAWRFRAGPEDRRIVAYDQLESAWPVHGSVLVEGGIACAVAGRSAYLDGGLTLYRLDAATGRMLSATPVTADALPDVLSSDGTSLFMRHNRFDRDGVEQKTRVPHLFSPAGFLDGEGWHRTYWQVGTQMQSGWGAWPNVGNRVPAGRLLVVDGDTVYGFGRLNQYHRNGSHIGMGRTRYRLFACAAKPEPARKGASAKPVCHWSQRLPIMPRAMLLSGKTLFAAGPPDMLATEPTDNDHPYAIGSVEELKAQDRADTGADGGVLCIVSATDGKTLGTLKLQAPPVWDGMAATDGRLYMAAVDGTVICLGER